MDSLPLTPHFLLLVSDQAGWINVKQVGTFVTSNNHHVFQKISYFFYLHHRLFVRQCIKADFEKNTGIQPNGSLISNPSSRNSSSLIGMEKGALALILILVSNKLIK